MSEISGSRDHSSIAHPELVEPQHAPDLPPDSLQPLVSLEEIDRSDLSVRQLRPEWMDRPDVDPRALEVSLRALESYNWISFTHHQHWSYIRQLAVRNPEKQIRVLDVACGGGDIAVKLARVARRSKLNVTVDGCDLSQTAVDFATRRASQAGVPCRFFPFDVTRTDWPTDYDVVCSSLFLRHLPTPLVETVLSRMAGAAKQLVLANDLVRSRLGYRILRYGTLVVTRSPVARYDGPVSVAGAFTLAEMRQMATNAGLTGATVKGCWPERMMLIWHKS
jgi:2-polyprenyl-3-methyl-5-hydroxy-6-metoxy-1,4-benzoquinol methylase